MVSIVLEEVANQPLQCHSLEAVEVCMDVEMFGEAVQEQVPAGLAVQGGGRLEALSGVLPSNHEHISHGIPELRCAIEVQTFKLEWQGRSVTHAHTQQHMKSVRTK